MKNQQHRFNLQGSLHMVKLGRHSLGLTSVPFAHMQVTYKLTHRSLASQSCLATEITVFNDTDMEAQQVLRIPSIMRVALGPECDLIN